MCCLFKYLLILRLLLLVVLSSLFFCYIYQFQVAVIEVLESCCCAANNIDCNINDEGSSWWRGGREWWGRQPSTFACHSSLSCYFQGFRFSPRNDAPPESRRLITLESRPLWRFLRLYLFLLSMFRRKWKSGFRGCSPKAVLELSRQGILYKIN